MAKIKSILRKKINSQNLWNLAVKDDESFIASDIVVHNCKSFIAPVYDVDKNPLDPTGLKPTDPKLDKFITL